MIADFNGLSARRSLRSPSPGSSRVAPAFTVTAFSHSAVKLSQKKNKKPPKIIKTNLEVAGRRRRGAAGPGRGAGAPVGVTGPWVHGDLQASRGRSQHRGNKQKSEFRPIEKLKHFAFMELEKQFCQKKKKKKSIIGGEFIYCGSKLRRWETRRSGRRC